jgi:hypothetical protein
LCMSCARHSTSGSFPASGCSLHRRRGPFDDSVARMLLQLLEKHGLGGCVETNAAVSSSNIVRLNSTGVTVVCLSYLDLGSSPAHLRHSIKRIRRQIADATLIVGLWATRTMKVASSCKRPQPRTTVCHRLEKRSACASTRRREDSRRFRQRATQRPGSRLHRLVPWTRVRVTMDCLTGRSSGVVLRAAGVGRSAGPLRELPISFRGGSAVTLVP